MSPNPKDFALDESRYDILRVAAECFMERGYAATSIDDVARRLGATKGRIYHHFHSKTELFAAVVRTGMDVLYDAISPHSNSKDGPLVRWRKMAFCHTMQMMESKPFQRAVWEGVEMHLRGATTPEQRSTLEQLMRYRTDYGARFRQLLAAARQSGQMEFDNISLANQLMFMTLNSPIFWYSPRTGETRQDRETIAHQVVAYASRGLGATEGKQPT